MKYKIPSSTVSASKLLCRTVIINAGGSSEVGRVTGFSRQAIHIFEKIGYVPLNRVYEIASALHVSPWHLSYFKLLEVFGQLAPTFPSLVKSCTFLSDSDKAFVLKTFNK